jgi:hypothetical protein
MEYDFSTTELILYYSNAYLGHGLSAVGGFIVSAIFYRKLKKSQNLVNISFLNLVASTAIYGLVIFVLEFIHIFFDFVFPQSKTFEVRYAAIVFEIDSLFTFLCSVWAMLCCVSILISMKNLGRKKESKWLYVIFSIFGYGIPIIYDLFWLFFIQFTIADDMWFGYFSKNVRIILEFVYFLTYSIIITLIFILNFILTLVIFSIIKKSYNKIQKISLVNERRQQRKQISAAYNLSLYLLPFLICNSWLILTYITYILTLIDKNEVIFSFTFYRVIYCISFFFYPYKGFLYLLIYILNHKRVRQIWSFCSKKKEKFDDVAGTIEDKTEIENHALEKSPQINKHK